MGEVLRSDLPGMLLSIMRIGHADIRLRDCGFPP
jgi:hypothetical protein